MPKQTSSLRPDALRKLRMILKAMDGDRSAVPMRELVALASDVDLGGTLTVDFTAEEELGHALVVLQERPQSASATRLACLTPREMEVAGLVAGGKSNKEMAVQLGISLATVKDHLHHILEKTGLPNRAAVTAAYLGHDPSHEARDKH